MSAKRKDEEMEEIKLFTDNVICEMGMRIQKERRKKGFKAIDFADIIGIGKDQLSRIENGKVPCKIEYLYVIAQLLQVSVDFIMFGKNKDEMNNDVIFVPTTMSDGQKEKLRRIVSILTEE